MSGCEIAMSHREIDIDLFVFIADYKIVCDSPAPLFQWNSSIHPSIRRSVRPSVHPSVVFFGVSPHTWGENENSENRKATVAWQVQSQNLFAVRQHC